MSTHVHATQIVARIVYNGKRERKTWGNERRRRNSRRKRPGGGEE